MVSVLTANGFASNGLESPILNMFTIRQDYSVKKGVESKFDEERKQVVSVNENFVKKKTDDCVLHLFILSFF